MLIIDPVSKNREGSRNRLEGIRIPVPRFAGRLTRPIELSRSSTNYIFLSLMFQTAAAHNFISSPRILQQIAVDFHLSTSYLGRGLMISSSFPGSPSSSHLPFFSSRFSLSPLFRFNEPRSVARFPTDSSGE